MNFSLDELDWIRHCLSLTMEEYANTSVYDLIKPICDKINDEIHYQES